MMFLFSIKEKILECNHETMTLKYSAIETRTPIKHHLATMRLTGKGNYICIFDGEKAIGFYDIDDLSLSQNLIANTNEEMIQIEKSCKAFIKDYFDRIIDKNLK